MERIRWFLPRITSKCANSFVIVIDDTELESPTCETTEFSDVNAVFQLALQQLESLASSLVNSKRVIVIR